MKSRLIHPRVMETLVRDFFTERGSIQQATKTQSTTGQEKKQWADVPGWVNIPCRIAAAGGGERRFQTQAFLDATDTAILRGTFNGLNEEMRFVIGDRNYDILRVEPDSEGINTRLTLRTVK